MAAGVITIFSTSRVLIIVLQEASYVTPTGYCIAISDIYGVTPMTQYIGITLYTSTVVVQIIFSACALFWSTLYQRITTPPKLIAAINVY